MFFTWAVFVVCLGDVFCKPSGFWPVDQFFVNRVPIRSWVEVEGKLTFLFALMQMIFPSLETSSWLVLILHLPLLEEAAVLEE